MSDKSLTAVAFTTLKLPANWPSVVAMIGMVRARNDLQGFAKGQVYFFGTLLCDYFRAAYREKAIYASGPFPTLLDYVVDEVEWTDVAKALWVYYDLRVSPKAVTALIEESTAIA